MVFDEIGEWIKSWTVEKGIKELAQWNEILEALNGHVKAEE